MQGVNGMTKQFGLVLSLAMVLNVSSVQAADNVSFSVSNQTLEAAMTELKAKSGLEFTVAPDLEDDLLTTDVHDKDWHTLVRRVLTGYNYVSRFNRKTGRMEVRISSRTKEKTTAAVVSSN
jgi:hypothetical protein